jgi:NitT/TauT family transport system substrate-binding protein
MTERAKSRRATTTRAMTTRAMTRRVISALALFLLFASTAAAQSKIAIGHTPIGEVDALYVGIEQGYFGKHGLDVELMSSGINTTLAAALVGGSVQIAAPSPTVLLQAVDGGLDLVGIAGCGVTSARTAKNIALMVRPGITLTSPRDLEGKKVGVPGLGATLHVMLRYWLTKNGVDPAKVTFIEVPIPNAADALHSGSVDALVNGEPAMSRAVSTGAGTVAQYFMADLPPDLPYIVFAATRDWAAKNPTVVTSFQNAIAESAAFTKSDDAKTKEYISKYTKLPLALVQKIEAPECDPVLKPQQLSWFADVMAGQDMLQGKLDVANLIIPAPTR